MKKVLFVLLAFLPSFSVVADVTENYTHFAIDGNSWQYDRHTGSSDIINRELVMNGTSEIDGKTYINLYDHEIGKPLGDAVAFVREGGHKIFARGSYLEEYVGDCECLVFDYDNIKNPESLWNSHSETGYFDGFAEREDVLVFFEWVKLDSGLRNRVVVSPVDDYISDMVYGAVIFVEGVGFVGAPEYFTNLFLPSVATTHLVGADYDVFVSMTDANGNVVYDTSKNYETGPSGGIDGVIFDGADGSYEWYDLRGVRLAEKPATAGIYIVRHADGTAKKVAVR